MGNDFRRGKASWKVKDIQDELHMLKAVMAEQQSVWKPLTVQNGNSKPKVEEELITDRGSEDTLGELESGEIYITNKA